MRLEIFKVQIKMINFKNKNFKKNGCKSSLLGLQNNAHGNFCLLFKCISYTLGQIHVDKEAVNNTLKVTELEQFIFRI